jgi:hypothetical protein
MIYVLGTKVRMAVIFDDKYKHSQELITYVEHSLVYERALEQFADHLFFLRESLSEQMLAMFDIEGAVDLLLGDCTTRFPLSIFRKEKKFSGNPDRFFQLVQNILKVKLMSVQLPPNSRIRLNQGRAILTVANCYRLYLSIIDPDGPFIASKLTFLLPSFIVVRDDSHARELMCTQGRDLRFNQIILQRSVFTLLASVNRLLENGTFQAVDQLLQRTIALFDFRRLCLEARRIARSSTRESVDFRCRAPKLQQVICEFWQSPDEALMLSLHGLSIDVIIKDQVVGNARGRKLEDILAECMREAAIRRLKMLQERLKIDGAERCVLFEEGEIPRLELYGEKIVCAAYGGMFVIVGKPKLFPKEIKNFPAFVRNLKLAEEIRIRGKKW